METQDKMAGDPGGTDIETLELDGYRIVDIVAGDVQPTRELQYVVDRIIGEHSDTFYSDMLHAIASERFPEEDAKKMWQAILHHKYNISEKLGRNVGVRVAALDYLENIKKIIQAPKIVDETEFRKTLTLAVTDPLTGLYNRRKFNEELLLAIREASVAEKKFSLMMLDLDGFKKFNDTKGHQAGDEVLVQFAEILREELRKGSVIGRYGGDEMVIIVSGVDRPDAKKVAARICSVIQEKFRGYGITVSIGIAEFPDDGRSFEEMIAKADEVLYRAKEFGGNRVSCFVPVKLEYNPGDRDIMDVACVGDFNRWHKKFGTMIYNEAENRWEKNLNIKPGRYRYKFLVDGSRWMVDPAAEEYVDDGFGGRCSILTVRMEDCNVCEN